MRSSLLVLLLIVSPACLWSQGTPEIKFLENMPTKDGFSAELRLEANKAIFEEITPNPEHLDPVVTARRGIPFYTVILFANAATTKGKTDLTYSVVIKRPDGSVYGEGKNIAGWKYRRTPTPGLVHIAMGTLMIKIEPIDPPGKYTVEAEIRDNGRKTTIHSEKSFLVDKEP